MILNAGFVLNKTPFALCMVNHFACTDSNLGQRWIQMKHVVKALTCTWQIHAISEYPVLIVTKPQCGVTTLLVLVMRFHHLFHDKTVRHHSSNILGLFPKIRFHSNNIEVLAQLHLRFSKNKE